MSECGYQQFDILDVFNMFENPHGLDEISEEEKSQLRLLYQVIIAFLFLIFYRTNVTSTAQPGSHQRNPQSTYTSVSSLHCSTSMFATMCKE
jgi:hypothetical protein